MSRSRRDLMRGAAAFTAALAVPWAAPWRGARAAEGAASIDAGGQPVHGYGPLLDDPQRVLDLPAGFSYRVISRVGDVMDDGLRVPGRADGMHAFALGAHTVLLRNHELNVGARDHAFVGQTMIRGDRRAKLYDPAVGAGGASTLVLGPDGLRVRRQFLSLAGTLRNCAGGATPWGSWLSCEESVVRRGQHGALRDHGYAFEVPAAARELVAARPLTAMGRFYREAVAVDPDSGIVYQSEDLPDGLFYRFIPDKAGQLAAGGRLQAMSIDGLAGHSSANRAARRWQGGTRPQGPGVPPRTKLAVRWVDLDRVDSPDDDLRHRGLARGATSFARGEGLAVQRCKAGVCIWFMCTSGGARGLGQLWRYQPAPVPARAGSRGTQASGTGTMELFLEPSQASIMRHGDNLALAPNGDVIVCEDQSGLQRLLGVTASGGVYTVARNPRGDSELAGACFGPRAARGAGAAGDVLYLNIQRRGLTLAVSGPWQNRDTRPRM